MSLAVLRQNIISHSTNRWARDLGYAPVYTASETARIVVVGQAPGRAAQQSRTPWNDPSGDRLRDWLGLTRAQFYDERQIALLAMDFYYPGKGKGGDLPPRPDFAPRWHPQLLACMPKVEFMILAGRYAQQYYLPEVARHNSLTETVRRWREFLPGRIPLVHPSPLNFRWRRDNPWFEAEVVPAARERVQEIFGRVAT